MKIHITEEARHLCFARNYLTRNVPKLGWFARQRLAYMIPVILGEMASMMLDEGIYVIGFCYPVVPKGQARIRVQISAAHTTDDIDQAMNAFAKVRDACRE